MARVEARSFNARNRKSGELAFVQYPEALDSAPVLIGSMSIWRSSLLGLELYIPIAHTATFVAYILLEDHGFWLPCSVHLLLSEIQGRQLLTQTTRQRKRKSATILFLLSAFV